VGKIILINKKKAKLLGY